MPNKSESFVQRAASIGWRAVAAGGIAWSAAACEPALHPGNQKGQTLQPAQGEQLAIVPDLGLKIDEAEWLKTLQLGSKWELVPSVFNSDDNWSSDKSNTSIISLVNASNNFIISANRPMAEFMFKEAKINNSVAPIFIGFADNWLPTNINGDSGVGLTREMINGNKNAFVAQMSLNAVTWITLKLMEEEGLPDSEFESIASFVLSHTTVHEEGHAGAQFNTFWRLNKGIIPPDANGNTHQQIYAFGDNYVRLYREAESRQQQKHALVFSMRPTNDFDLNSFREKIYREGKKLGLD